MGSTRIDANMIQRFLTGLQSELAPRFTVERDAATPEAGRPSCVDANASESRTAYRTIWISDTHLGTKGCRADLLLDFLQSHDCERLYLVGDIIDGWRLKKSWYWNEEQNRVVKEVLQKSEHGTRVHYICGNHDEFLREYVGLEFGGVKLQNEVVHRCADGRRLLVMHGDGFDVVIRNAKWLAFLGDHAYRACLVVNLWFNWLRAKFGYGYWSLSAYLKAKVKNAVSYVGRFEDVVAAETKSRGFDGVVCGHIHHAEMREVRGVLYCNDGDWVESCTALVERLDGSLAIVRWAEEVEARSSRASAEPAALGG